MGKIVKVSGPLVVATGMSDANMADVVRVGEQHLIGEILNMNGDSASIQVYEETSGLGPGAEVVTTGAPLSVELGPGLIENIYDGIQRPLEEIMKLTGSNITRGVEVPALNREKKWDFVPEVKAGTRVTGGQEYRCTRLDGVPTIFMMLVEATKDPGVDLSSLKSGVMAGSSYSPEQFQAIEEALHICLYPSYGMTEMSPIICSPASDAPFDVRSRSVGPFAYGVTGVLKALSGEHVTGVCQEGEICVRGYMLMLGYHEDDGTLTRPLDEEGFFHTGDLGYLDEQGNLHITGRCKDIIIRGGENISCARIHSCVTRLPGVYDAVVMGIPDPKYGETVGIFAVTDSYDEAGLLKDLGNVLRSCEMPASLIVSDKMPVNAAAKPDRKTIRLLLEKAAKKGVL